MMTLKKTVLLFPAVALIIAFGFFREFIFENVNGQTSIAYYHSEQRAVSEHLKFIWGMNYEKLFYLKWLLTIIFALIYLGFSCLVIKIIFNNNQFIKYTIWSYVIVLIVSFFFMAIGYLIPPAATKAYEFARYLMGFAQSPVILMILVPAFTLSGKYVSTNRIEEKK